MTSTQPTTIPQPIKNTNFDDLNASASFFSRFQELGTKVQYITQEYPCASAVFFVVYAFFGFYNLFFGTLTNFILYTVPLAILSSGMMDYENYAEAFIAGCKDLANQAVGVFKKQG